MLLKNLTRVYVSRAEERKDHGEIKKTWKFVSTAFLNLQQDINELDRKSSGKVSYDILKARTDQNCFIPNGYGVSLKNVARCDNFKPEYRVLAQSRVGSTTLYRLERYYGD